MGNSINSFFNTHFASYEGNIARLNPLSLMPSHCDNADAAGYSALIATIYDAALDPARWHIIVGELQDSLDGVGLRPDLRSHVSAWIDTMLVSDRWIDPSLTNEAMLRHSQNRAALRRAFSLLAPHFRRAFAIRRQLGDGTVLNTIAESLLNSLLSPALIVSEDLKVTIANHAADELFRTRNLQLDANGRIAAGNSPANTSVLRSAVKEAVTQRHIPKEPSIVPIETRLQQTRPLFAWITPCACPQHRSTPTRRPSPPPSQLRQALLVIVNPEAKVLLSNSLLQSLYGLTPCEARLARELVRGIALKDYAAASGITEGTARIELKSVFAKTSTHRQAELVAVLATLSIPVGPAP